MQITIGVVGFVLILLGFVGWGAYKLGKRVERVETDKVLDVARTEKSAALARQKAELRTLTADDVTRFIRYSVVITRDDAMAALGILKALDFDIAAAAREMKARMNDISNAIVHHESVRAGLDEELAMLRSQIEKIQATAHENEGVVALAQQKLAKLRETAKLFGFEPEEADG